MPDLTPHHRHHPVELSGDPGVPQVSPGGPAPGTLIEERPESELQRSDPGDHDRFAHYIWGKDPKAKITQSMVLGTPIKALCGKKWVPSRDGTRYPVCPDCKAIKARLQGGGDDGGDQ